MADGINNRGDIVGRTDPPVGPAGWHGFVTINGVTQTIAPPAGFSNLWPFRINNSGQMAGVTYNSFPEPQGFFYQNGSLTTIGRLPNTDFCMPFSINDRGWVVGTCTNPSKAFVWANGTTTPLLGQGSGVQATDINDYGTIVGTAINPGLGVNRPVFLYKNRPASDLGALPNSTHGYATSINNNFKVVGYYEMQGGGIKGFIWQGGAMTEIPTLPGYTHYQPYKINDRGDIIGTLNQNSNQCFIVLQGQMHLFRDLLPNGGIEWNGLSLTDINDNGVVTGVGGYQGNWRGFIARPVP